MPKKKQVIMDVYFNPTPAYTARIETYNGTPHLVVPVVMLVEGVHSGNHGPVLHLASEMEIITDSWNGIPVTIGHPQVNDQYVSANSPTVLRDWAVGTIFNARMENNKLQAEAWIEQTRLQALSSETLVRINNGDIMEVSTGLFSNSEIVDGVHNNESYVSIARNYRPDHLALLPGEVGACSINDGCGLRVNKKGGTKMPDEVLVVNEENQSQVLKELSRKGFSINQTGFTEIAHKAQRMLDGMDNETHVYFLEELFDDYLIYKVRIRQEDGTRITKFFRQDYQETADGNIELTGEPLQVKREVMYPTIPQTNKGGSRTNFNNPKKKEVTIMAEKCTECVKAKVDDLIANKSVAYGEEHREQLEALSEEMLEMMTPQKEKVEPQVNVDEPKPVEVTKEAVLGVLKDASEEEFLAAMPEGMRNDYTSARTLQANVKATLVKDIMDNTADGIWTKEGLETMGIETLKSIHQSAGIKKVEEQSFVGNGNPLNTNTGEEECEPMLMPGTLEESKN